LVIIIEVEYIPLGNKNVSPVTLVTELTCFN